MSVPRRLNSKVQPLFSLIKSTYWRLMEKSTTTRNLEPLRRKYDFQTDSDCKVTVPFIKIWVKNSLKNQRNLCIRTHDEEKDQYLVGRDHIGIILLPMLVMSMATTMSHSK